MISVNQVSQEQNIITHNNHFNKYCEGTGGHFLLHAQVGIAEDKGIVPGTRIPIGEEPEELINGTIDPDHVRQLICGYQVTALVMDDGRMYMWGNNNSMLSLAEFANKEKYNTGVQKVAFSNYYAILLKEDGTVTGGQTLTFNKQTAYSKTLSTSLSSLSTI